VEADAALTAALAEVEAAAALAALAAFVADDEPAGGVGEEPAAAWEVEWGVAAASVAEGPPPVSALEDGRRKECTSEEASEVPRHKWQWHKRPRK
jgi:hypothetical protein